MAINVDNKYYTPKWLVDLMMEKIGEHIGWQEVIEIIEPSAGDGAFIPAIKCQNKSYRFYDLYPEHPEVTQCDFLKLYLPYKKGRLILGNPPFAIGKNFLYKTFIRHSSEMGDYIAFILPISQYNKNSVFKNLDLIYSQKLDMVEFYGVNNVSVLTCLNIYKVGAFIKINKYAEIDRDIKLIRIGVSNFDKRFPFNGKYWNKDINIFNADCYFSHFGSPIYFTTDKNDFFKCGYIGVVILNEEKREELIEFFRNFNDMFLEELNRDSTSAPSIDFVYIKNKLLDYVYNK